MLQLTTVLCVSNTVTRLACHMLREFATCFFSDGTIKGYVETTFYVLFSQEGKKGCLT